MTRESASSQSGQTLVLFAASAVVLFLMTGLVVDAGYAFAQRRSAQNAADFAAVAGSRILGESFTGKPAGAGTDLNVLQAARAALAANHADFVSAQYVNGAGALAGPVGTGSIPPSAAGVVVNATTAWRPFFLGIIGVTSWSAGADATALTKGTAAGGVLPIGIQKTTRSTISDCAMWDRAAIRRTSLPGLSTGPATSAGFRSERIRHSAVDMDSGCSLRAAPSARASSRTRSARLAIATDAVQRWRVIPIR